MQQKRWAKHLLESERLILDQVKPFSWIFPASAWLKDTPTEASAFFPGAPPSARGWSSRAAGRGRAWWWDDLGGTSSRSRPLGNRKEEHEKNERLTTLNRDRKWVCADTQSQNFGCCSLNHVLVHGPNKKNTCLIFLCWLCSFHFLYSFSTIENKRRWIKQWWNWTIKAKNTKTLARPVKWRANAKPNAPPGGSTSTVTNYIVAHQ